MALKLVEFFGYAPRDGSAAARAARAGLHCPFLNSRCEKTLHDGAPSGACTVRQASGGPIIACPNRLYHNHYQVLLDVAQAAFGADVRLVRGQEIEKGKYDPRNVVVFGRRWGKELRLPGKLGHGAYFVDWILVRITEKGGVRDFAAVEVQSIDTTGNYRDERDAYLHEQDYAGNSPAGLNWENVSKRILPQIIYKGHVLRREKLCAKGLFFVCPTPVYEHIRGRLGGAMYEYNLQPGALTFRWYNIGPAVPDGQIRDLVLEGSFTTTIDQVALAFTSPKDLPPENVYLQAIELELTQTGH